MRNYIKGAAVAAMMVLSLASCRKESDTVHNFSYMDVVTWQKAKDSYGEKFKILWEGLNSNYGIWDYEKELGLDWDAVYDKYYPKFTELDTLLSKTGEVTDDKLRKLVQEVVAPLHDGHLFIMVQNHMTGNFIDVSPNKDRNKKEREKDYNEAQVGGQVLKPSLTYYYNTPGKLKDFKTVDATTSTQLLSVLDSLSGWSKRMLDSTSRKTLVTQEELMSEFIAKTMENELDQVRALKSNEQIINGINTLALKYAYLDIPGVHVLDEKLIKSGIDMTYALFEGNIAYLRFDSFSITPYLSTFVTEKSTLQPYAQQLSAQVADVWNAWFGAIQELHKTKQLGGVIIDVRGNGGGMDSDYAYVLGALLPSGGHHSMDTRMKRGIGRYDYSPMIPQVMPTFVGAHVTVTEPIVVLTNLHSVSMAEITAVGAKVVDNAKVVGTRTWGGLCGLMDNDTYSINYAGHIGVEGETPVYVYCPCEASFTKDGRLLEGVGVTPDIEVHLDKAAWNNGLGPDSQLDRAIQYITTGK